MKHDNREVDGRPGHAHAKGLHAARARADLRRALTQPADRDAGPAELVNGHVEEHTGRRADGSPVAHSCASLLFFPTLGVVDGTWKRGTLAATRSWSRDAKTAAEGHWHTGTTRWRTGNVSHWRRDGARAVSRRLERPGRETKHVIAKDTNFGRRRLAHTTRMRQAARPRHGTGRQLDENERYWRRRTEGSNSQKANRNCPISGKLHFNPPAGWDDLTVRFLGTLRP